LDRKKPENVALACSVVGGFWMVTVGHYYFHNAVVFGSPVYPHQINVGPLHLPGTADLSYSSILYNLTTRGCGATSFCRSTDYRPRESSFP